MNWQAAFVTVLLAHVRLSVQQENCSTECYENLGCFTNCPPFNLFTLPESPDKINTHFRLYTRDTPGLFDFELISAENPGTLFEARRETIYLVHGYLSTWLDQWVHDFRETFLQLDDYNIIVVDWEGGAGIGSAPFSSANVQVVGAEMAHLARVLNEQRGLQYSDVYAIGYSMGGQVVGHFGKRLDGQVGRITSLDPAAGLFNSDSPEVRVDSSDAAFVEVIHTNVFSPLVPVGMNRDAGHVDFWPNSGNLQPGCGVLNGDSCSHERAHIYYLASLRGLCVYQGQPCETFEDMLEATCPACNGDNCQVLGFDAVNQPGRGRYYVEVTSDYPHCV